MVEKCEKGRSRPGTGVLWVACSPPKQGLSPPACIDTRVQLPSLAAPFLVQLKRHALHLHECMARHGGKREKTKNRLGPGPG